jgi:serine/threonine protein kinase
MISARRLCPKCGWEIPADAPEQGCPGCLLESGLRLFDQEAVAGVGYLGDEDKPTHADKRSGLVQMLGELGDYELLEEVGRGGQGVVFRARQKSLNRTVALKVISLGQWASKAHLKRFRREAEAAASLDHPSIVPIYEVGERDGSCYFSMKFIEGGQLDEVVKHTSISIRHAAELIAKMARTVHYAHEHGILHRDIKPGNILLDAKGEPHLTDFGLAGLVETESTITRTLEVMGTPSYMAPEQAAGEHTKVSSATDVYGLGAVLYELLTGHPPFAGGTSYQTIRLLLDTEPRQPRLWNRNVDREVSTICLKCLEKESTRRYSSALALAEDLEHWLKHEPILARRSGVFSRGSKWVRRNPTSALLAASLVALTATAGWMVWETVRQPMVTNGIAVLPFENLSHDPDNAYFVKGIQEEILTRLAGIAGLKVISRTSTQQYQNKPRNLGEIAKQLGVAHVLEGSVQKAADQVRVNVQLINAQTDSHLWADTYDRKLTDIFGVESEIAKRIAESLQANMTRREEQVLAVKPTNNSEAYEAYLRGLALETSVGYSFDSLPKIIEFYERAVQLDPSFARAWGHLSCAHAYCYFIGEYQPIRATLPPGGPAAACGDAARKALENAQKFGPNDPMTLLALGYYQFWVLRDFGLAKSTFKQVRKTMPGSSEAARALGSVGQREGQWDESIAYLEQALVLDPRNPDILGETAKAYAILRQFPKALSLINRALDILPNDTYLVTLKSIIYQAQGNLQEAAKLLVDVNIRTPSDEAFGNKVKLLTFERNLGEAIRLLQARTAEFKYGPGKSRWQVWLAILQRLAGDTAGAKATAEEALKTLESLDERLQGNPNIVQALSLLKAEMGEKDSALKDAERAIMLAPSDKNPVEGPALEETLAQIYTLFGENGRAISILTRLLQTPYISISYYPMPITSAHLRLDPRWDQLRGDPAFQELCQEKQP